MIYFTSRSAVTPPGTSLCPTHEASFSAQCTESTIVLYHICSCMLANSYHILGDIATSSSSFTLNYNLSHEHRNDFLLSQLLQMQLQNFDYCYWESTNISALIQWTSTFTGWRPTRSAQCWWYSLVKVFTMLHTRIQKVHPYENGGSFKVNNRYNINIVFLQIFYIFVQVFIPKRKLSWSFFVYIVISIIKATNHEPKIAI